MHTCAHNTHTLHTELTLQKRWRWHTHICTQTHAQTHTHTHTNKHAQKISRTPTHPHIHIGNHYVHLLPVEFPLGLAWRAVMARRRYEGVCLCVCVCLCVSVCVRT